ncbi:hypothetical protein APR04_003912 [Promicromonospora umidemergens]|uniref:CopC domain-containing protein n=1 Tax=Promicromonospora umidemergens TaxID=629679 RepID=A0ABP8X6Z2_9MICO|nr:copper resistance CopC family protein [Promicromonospora umidemergens]MCP2284985.1 hypothetical protein [Promicromonospora umidemergens]
MHIHHTALIPSHRPRTGLRQYTRRAGAAALFVIGLLLLTAPPATAHDRLLSSAPADGTTVTALPPEIVLTLSEAPLATGAQVAVTATDGSMLSTGPVSVEEATVTVPVTGQGPAGTYTVAWHVVSSDGHPIEGAVEFALEPATQASPSPTADQTEQSESAAAGPETASDESAPSATQGLAAPVDSHDNGRTTDPLVVVAVGIALAVVILIVITFVTRRRDDAPESGRSTDTLE